MAKQVRPVARQSLWDILQLRVDDRVHVFAIAGVHTAQSGRTYGNEQK